MCARPPEGGPLISLLEDVLLTSYYLLVNYFLVTTDYRLTAYPAECGPLVSLLED